MSLLAFENEGCFCFNPLDVQPLVGLTLMMENSEKLLRGLPDSKPFSAILRFTSSLHGGVGRELIRTRPYLNRQETRALPQMVRPHNWRSARGQSLRN